MTSDYSLISQPLHIADWIRGGAEVFGLDQCIQCRLGRQSSEAGPVASTVHCCITVILMSSAVQCSAVHCTAM